MVWCTMRFIAAINCALMLRGGGSPVRGTWSSVKKSMPQAAHSNTLTTHSPSCRRLRGVSIIGRPQLAQVGDFGMAVGECGVWCGCSALPVLPVAFVVKRRCEINSDCELF